MTKILVADDEADLETLIRQKFRQKIRQQEYEFVFAINGKDAIRKIEQHPDIDMILSDINMPEMDGYEVAATLRKQGVGATIVALSGYGQEEDRERGRRAGFDYHLVKPVGGDELQNLLREIEAKRA